jgi:hypothetical protein
VNIHKLPALPLLILMGSFVVADELNNKKREE